MTFWLIVLGIIGVVLVIAWRHDRKHGRGVKTMRSIQVGVEKAEGKSAEAVQRFHPPRPGGLWRP